MDKLKKAVFQKKKKFVEKKQLTAAKAKGPPKVFTIARKREGL
jgi:hypothetical protein